MAIAPVLLRPEADFLPVPGESFAAYRARRDLVAQRRHLNDIFAENLRQFLALPIERQVETGMLGLL